jgi:heme/copper-type cytochrome/quinol oxidase subunit 1
MTRLAIVLTHLFALPIAVLLSVSLTVPLATSAAVEVALRDTHFVVAHFHTSIILVCFAGVATLVAHRYGHFNRGLVIAWILLLIHVLSAVVLPRPDTTVFAPAVITVSTSERFRWFLYVVSAVGALVSTVCGLLMSLVAALRSARVRAA